DQWIREHAFHFTNDGRLHPRRRHAEPAYLAQHSEERVASVEQKFAVLKTAYNPGVAEYLYNGNTYCAKCAGDVTRKNAKISEDGCPGIKPMNNIPDGPFYSVRDDVPHHCAKCGRFLENELTQEGYSGLRTAAQEGEILQ